MAVYKPEDSPAYPTEYDKLVAVIAENERLRQQVQESRAREEMLLIRVNELEKAYMEFGVGRLPAPAPDMKEYRKQVLLEAASVCSGLALDAFVEEEYAYNNAATELRRMAEEE